MYAFTLERPTTLADAVKLAAAGAIGSPPAVMNAVLDALAPLGVKELDMPASPHRVWSAIQAAKH